MLRSMKTTNPLQAWTQVHRHFVTNVRGDRLSGEFVDEKLAMYCTSSKAMEDTINWAIEHGFLDAHRDEAPTSYSLTEKGRAWSSNN